MVFAILSQLYIILDRGVEMSVIVILACSPRINGNSDFMAEAAYDALLKNGQSAELVYLRDFNFSPCIGCNSCYIKGECVFRSDDAEKVFTKLLTSEKIIISAPIFFQSLGALPKGLIDRAQRFWSIKNILKKHVIADEEFRKKRKVHALLCGGTNFPDTFICAEKIIRLFSMMIEAKYAGGSFFPAIDAKGDILRDEDNLRHIKEAILAL